MEQRDGTVRRAVSTAGPDAGSELTDLPDRVQRLCRRHATGEVDDFFAGDESATAALNRIVAAVAGGEPDPHDLKRDLDELERLARKAGISGLTTPVRTIPRPPAGNPGHPVAYAVRCPIRACSHRAVEYGEQEPPLDCAIGNKPMRRTRLDL